jgi:hypothetical protein
MTAAYGNGNSLRMPKVFKRDRVVRSTFVIFFCRRMSKLQTGHPANFRPAGGVEHCREEIYGR